MVDMDSSRLRQRALVSVPENHPLLPIEFCAVVLRASVDGVLNLIEAGRLKWSFDISTPDTRRMEVRIWRTSFLWLLERQRSNEGSESSSETARAVVRSILPANRPTVTSTELMARLFCSQSHVTNLLREGALEQVGQPVKHQGVNAIRRIATASVARFLMRRVIK